MQKLLIIGLALIYGVSCQNGWIKGPDGYKYIQPNIPLEYPIVSGELPPIQLLALNTNGPEPLGAVQFAPFIPKTILEDVEATTFEYEIVKK